MDKKDGSMFLLVLICIVAMMDCLDGSVVNVALPSIATDLGVDMATVSWLTVSYYAMMAGLIILFGKIATNTSIKKVLLGGLVLFVISSTICGLSNSFAVLIGARLLQGVGAAMMGATGPMACVRYFSPKILGFALSCMTIGYSVGAALGPSVGGFLVEYMSWHWIFFINIPIGLLLIAALHFSMKEVPPVENVNVDYKGALLLFASIISLLMVLEFINTPMYMVPFLALFILFAASFVLFERKQEDPLFNLNVFRNRDFTFSIITFFLINTVYLGMLYLIPFFMNIEMGLSESQTGIFLLLPPIITLIFGLPIGRWSDKTGRRWFCVAAGVVVLIMAVILATSLGKQPVFMAIALAMGGFSWAFCGGPVMSRVVETVEGESREMASSVANEVAYLGSTMGTALFASLFSLSAGTFGVEITSLSPEVFQTGMTFTMLFAAVLAVVTIVLSYVVRDRPNEDGDAGDAELQG